jgi:16S rRNA (guanine527-N7)-methyltransferase
MDFDEQIIAGLTPYGITPDRRLRGQIRDYVSLLLLWNHKVSLTTIAKPEDIIRFHFGESFFIAKSLTLENGRLADVGSGAGFPGIPMAMLFRGLQVTLIEANAKKAAFLSEVIRKLALPNACVVRARMRDVELGGFDFITARALGPYEELLEWAIRSLSGSGKLILWLGEDDAARISQERGWSWQDPVRIPGSRRRVILIGSLEER